MSEHDEQVALFQMAELHQAQYPELEYLFSIPNGGHRHKVVAAKLKAEGVKSGVPDVCLPCQGNWDWGDFDRKIRSHALYIEMKVKSNKPTTNQEHWIDGLRELGNRVEVCYSAEEAWAVILDYLGYERSNDNG